MKINTLHLPSRKNIIFILLSVMTLFAISLGILYSIRYIPKKISYMVSYVRHHSQPHIANQYLQFLITTTLNNNPSNHNYTSLIKLLKNHINKHPTDMYNTNYLTNIGDFYFFQDAIPQAIYYYTQSITRLPFNQSPTINYEKISRLAKIEYEINKKIKYNSILLDFYPDNNTANIYFDIATLYDSVGNWDKAYHYYNKLLKNKSQLVSDSKEKIIESVFFRNTRYNSHPSKTWSTVYKVKQAVHYAIASRNSSYIKSLQATGFFTSQWQESNIAPNSHIPSFDLVPVSLRSSLKFDSTFSPYSIENEVLWSVYGWERVGVWYMVFRKIVQPDTIKLNGRWEWAGIYFGVGNKLHVPK